MLEAQKTQTGVIKTQGFAVAKMDGMGKCVCTVGHKKFNHNIEYMCKNLIYKRN